MRRKDIAIYFANDKDIYDLLMSSKVHYSDKKLLEMLRERGIVISSEMDREKLVRFFSTLPHDYHSFEMLLSQLPQRLNASKKQTTKISCDATIDQLSSIVLQLQDDRESKFNDSYSVSVGSDSVDVDVHYTEMDYSKARLRQRKTREAKFEIVVDAEGVKIRSDSAEKMTEIVRDLESRIENAFVDAKLDKLSLDCFFTPEQISEFFVSLATNMPGYSLVDVMTIKLEKMEGRSGDTEDTEDTEDIDPIVYEHGVKKAILSGDVLLASPEFQSLSDSGFFISNIRWVSSKVGNLHKYEFTASFDQSSDERELVYSVDGIYKNKGDGKYNLTRQNVTCGGKKVLLTDLEDHAASLLIASSGVSDEN